MTAENTRHANPVLKALSSFLKRIRHKTRVFMGFTIHFLVIRKYQWKMRRRDSAVRFIAVALIEHLGDIVACEPVSRLIRSREQGSKIIWFVKKEYRGLVSNNPNIDLVLTVHCLAERESLAKYCKFDQYFNLHFAERHCAICHETSDRGKKTEGNGITLSNFYTHGNILQSFSAFAGLPAANEPPQIYIDDNAKSRIDMLHLPSQFIVFHCSSNAVEKEWPREYWNRLSGYIYSTYGYHVVEVGIQRVQPDADCDWYLNTSGQLKILETAEVIRRSKLFVGIDSGPAHLANGVGVFGIILMGSYLGFSTYNPFSGGYGDGKNAILLQENGPVFHLPFERVLDAVIQVLSEKGK